MTEESNKVVLDSTATDYIKFTRVADIELERENLVILVFGDQQWVVEVKSQKTKHWAFSINPYLKVCPSGKKQAAITGWITDGAEEFEDDWGGEGSRHNFKVMKTYFEPGERPRSPMHIHRELKGKKPQIRLEFILFNENLRTWNGACGQNKTMERLFATKKGFDVIISTEGGELKAHKMFLKMKSKYFEAMFNQDLKEKEQEIVPVKDVNVETMNEILRFIYTGKVEDMDALAFDLLVWADFFAIDDLRDISSDHVVKSLTPENVLSVIELAVNTHQNTLKEEATKYFIRNMDKVVACDVWMTTYKKLPSSVQEIIKVLIK